MQLWQAKNNLFESVLSTMWIPKMELRSLGMVPLSAKLASGHKFPFTYAKNKYKQTICGAWYGKVIRTRLLGLLVSRNRKLLLLSVDIIQDCFKVILQITGVKNLFDAFPLYLRIWHVKETQLSCPDNLKIEKKVFLQLLNVCILVKMKGMPTHTGVATSCPLRPNCSFKIHTCQ